VGGYVIGPENIGLGSGIMPTDLANLTIANFPLMVIGAFGFGMLLMAVGALFVRAERNKVAASA
jgi:hypothetical protein